MAGHRSSPRRPKARGLRLAVAGITVAVLGSLSWATTPSGAQAATVQLETSLFSSTHEPAVAVGVPTEIAAGAMNSGRQPATNVVLTISLPPAATMIGSGDQDCASAAGSIVCSLGTLAASSGLSFWLQISFGSIGTHRVSAVASADQPDVDGESASHLDVTVVQEEADLWVSSSSERVVTGATHIVRQHLWNDGPTDAGGMSVSGTFPPGATVDLDTFHVGGDVNQAEGRCTFTSTAFSCGPLLAMGRGSGIDLRYVIVAPSESGPIAATATLTGRNDPNPTNDTGTLTLEVGEPIVELRLDLIAHGPQPAGQPFAARVWTWNTGDGVAHDVTTTLQVPEGWTVADPATSEAGGGTCDAAPADRLVSCTWATVQPSSRTEMVVLVTPPASGAGTGALVAVTTSPSVEPGEYPNTETVEVAYAPTGVDMEAVSAGHEPASPLSGPVRSTVTWQFRNNTPTRLGTDLRFTVSLPDGVHATYLQAFREDGGVSCDVDPDDRAPSCWLSGSALVSDYEVTIWVTYDTGGTYDLTAAASQSSPEQAPGDEALTHTVEVTTALADLQVTATEEAKEVTVDEETSYTVRVRNAGPSTAHDVDLSDELPGGVEVVSVRRGWVGWRCPTTDTGYTCHLGAMAPGATTFVVVTIRPTVVAALSSMPTVTSLEADPDLTSNADPVDVDVVAPGEEALPDLALLRSAAASPAVVGEPFTEYYLIVNDGPRAVTGVTFNVVEGEDENLDVTAAAFGWFSRPCGTTATCSIPRIAAGGYQIVTVTAVPQRAGTIATTATVTADQPDADPTDNTIVVEHPVEPPT